MTETHVALLRGINVGGHAKVTMESLRHLFHELGYRDVATYIQSGNVVFASSSAVSATRIEAAIMSELELAVTVVVRKGTDFQALVQSNPFKASDHSRVHVGFMALSPSPDALADLDVEKFSPDVAVVVPPDLYLHLPAGMGSTKLPDYLTRHLKVPITYRNWNTVTRLLAMTQAATK